MTNIQDLINAIRGATNVTINVNIDNSADLDNMEDIFTDDTPDTPSTDFEEGDRVLVCHVRKNGDRVHTVGTVIEALGQDDKGYYTRVLGDNGKHYRAGLTYNEERLGTIIYELD